MFISRQIEEDIFGIIKRASMPARQHCMICEKTSRDGDDSKPVIFVVCGFCRLKVE